VEIKRKSLIGSESRSKFLQLEEELTYRLRPVSISTPIKGILDCLSGEYDEKDGEKLEDMLGHLKKYKSLIDEVEAIRQIRPNRADEDHRDKLKKLFESITDTDIEVGVTKEEDKLLNGSETDRPDWTLIGFQGLDPITDFRGGGLLSLVQLIYFAEANHENIKTINERANHPTTGYGLAITGINITVMLVDALKSGQLKPYLYQQDRISLDKFHQIFSKCFLLFDQTWVEEKPEDIMKFSQIFSIFKAKLIEKMQTGSI